MKTKEILKYLDEGYCILVPVYYECEEKPAWKKVFVGSLQECKNNFDNYPDYLKATNEENNENRKRKTKEFLFLESIGKKKEAQKIKEAYHF